MEPYIKKSALVAEMKRLENDEFLCDSYDEATGFQSALRMVQEFIDTLEVKDPYEQCVQYDSIKAGIQAHAETYSFNIESELFNQLTKEQQKLWREEIEQAVISGGNAGYSFAKDTRYKENLEVKEVDLEKEFDRYCENLYLIDLENEPYAELFECAKYFFELGLKTQKGGKV